VIAATPALVVDVATYAGAFVTLAAAAAAVWRIPGVRSSWTRHFTEPRRVQRREDMETVLVPLLDPIRHELETNCGTSIKDAIKRLEESESEAKVWRAEITAKVDCLTERS
jgi:hypothetical protein